MNEVLVDAIHTQAIISLWIGAILFVAAVLFAIIAWNTFRICIKDIAFAPDEPAVNIQIMRRGVRAIVTVVLAFFLGIIGILQLSNSQLWIGVLSPKAAATVMQVSAPAH